MRLHLRLTLALLLTSLAPTVGAEDEVCPWCENDPERMAALGTVSHGPFPVAQTTSAELAKRLPATRWIFLETKHMRFGSSLGSVKLEAPERKALSAEIERMRAAFPKFPKQLRKLDPWMRLHLLALRSEDFYNRFQSLLRVTDADFPDKRGSGPFMGNGRYLGETDKYEVLFHASRSTHRMFCLDAIGVDVTDAVRWHFIPEHKLLASIPAEDSDLARQRHLFPHTAHVLSHLFLSGYKHFSYDPPPWLDEGLAHFLEREIEPTSTTIDGDEGAGPHRGSHGDWSKRERKLLGSRKTPNLAQLMAKPGFGSFAIEDHVTAWSLVRFLATEHPEEFAKLLGGVKGQLDDRGYPSGHDLRGLQRRLLSELWGWSAADVDEQWREWLQKR